MTQDQLIAEVLQYMQSYGCDYETARRDVLDEYGQPETDVDAFYTRTERPDGDDIQSPGNSVAFLPRV